MDALTLSQADTRRLERLAQAAGRTPRSLLKYVLRDGFEATEHAVQATTARMKTDERITHQDGMRQLDRLIEQHGRDKGRRVDKARSAYPPI
jgi:predicted transcriptional regulator